MKNTKKDVRNAKILQICRTITIIIILIGFVTLGLIDITHGRWQTGLASAMIGCANALLFLN